MTVFSAGALCGIMLLEFVRFAGRVRVTRELLYVLFKVENWRSLEYIMKRLDDMGHSYDLALSGCLLLMLLRGEVERDVENSRYRLTGEPWN